MYRVPGESDGIFNDRIPDLLNTTMTRKNMLCTGGSEHRSLTDETHKSNSLINLLHQVTFSSEKSTIQIDHIRINNSDINYTPIVCNSIIDRFHIVGDIIVNKYTGTWKHDI